ncbi:MAG: hypothetical protein QOI63_894 [Thermoplasmata archaeon]|nr:hypothetical protein [Thermoplasmata archaeon]
MVDGSQVGLNPVLAALCGLAALAAAVAVGSAQGTFAASPGFSGRGGQTCVACHHPYSPTNDDAKAVLEGLPAAWSLGQTYALTVRVTGGPPAMPAPQPQGGFDLASDGGSFSLRAEDAGKLRTYGPFEVTYRPEGTLQREWHVLWSAPTLAQRPAPVGVWLAVLAANGNHVVATNTTDQGETLDSTNAIHFQVQPDAAELAAWKALPLAAPTAALQQEAGAVHVEGRHADANATRVAWRLDGGAWQERATGPQWTLRLEGVGPGPHRLDYRSGDGERSSADQTLAFRVDGGRATPVAPGKAAPAAPLALILFLTLALAARRRHP